MRVIITGAAGQDGLILGQKLVRARHHDFGIVRMEAMEMLYWSPTKNCEETVRQMINFDLKLSDNQGASMMWKAS